MSKKKILIIALIVIVVGVLVYVNLASDSGRGTNVQASVATNRELVEMVSASGRIQPQTKVNITSEVTGEIISLYAKEGDQVKAGDLLIVLDTIALAADLQTARYAVAEIEARLEGAKASLDQAKEEYDRQDKLFQSKLTSETQYNNAKYTYLNAKSTYEASKAQSKQLKARLDKELENFSKARILAPMSGIITYVDCEVGEIAPAQTAYTQGKTLMTVSNLDVFEVEVEVDETEINKIAMGQSVDIEVDAFPDTTFPGEVVEIGNTALLTGLGTQDQSTDFKVKVIFKDANVRIRPGMSATVDIITNRGVDVLSIPYSCIVMRSIDLDSLARAEAGEEETPEPEPQESSPSEVHAAENDSLQESAEGEVEPEVKREDVKGVYVIREGIARFVRVETGIADQQNIEITSNLVKGDSVVSGPYSVLRTIKEGDAVKISEPRGE